MPYLAGLKSALCKRHEAETGEDERRMRRWRAWHQQRAADHNLGQLQRENDAMLRIPIGEDAGESRGDDEGRGEDKAGQRQKEGALRTRVDCKDDLRLDRNAQGIVIQDAQKFSGEVGEKSWRSQGGRGRGERLHG
jgi:hypothetical protein